MSAPSGLPPTGTGRLLLAATPIGNPQDASPRLRRALAEADVVAAEDTRRLRRLAAALDVEPAGAVVSFHEHNEASRAAGLVDRLRAGAVVLLVTDAGMPSVSDPGYRLVCAAVDAGVPVGALPGPSAVLTALALSALPVDRFCFEGFPPRKAGERDRALAALAAEPRTMVFFESPHRTAATLAALSATFGADRPAAVCRELTKTYEEVVRAPLGELAGWAAGREVLGEVTLVVAGSPARPPAADPADLVAAVEQRAGDGLRLKDAVAEVAGASGVAKRALYEAVLAARAGPATPPA